VGCVESEFIAFLTNQGLAIGLAAFLVYWVTTQMGSQLKAACESQSKLCENQIKMAQAMDSMIEKLQIHDVRAQEILTKVNTIEGKI